MKINTLRRYRHLGSFYAAFFILLCIAMMPCTSYALSTGGAGGGPATVDPGIQYSDSWFIYNLDLGESKADAIQVSNTSNESQTLKIYAVDSSATNDGTFSLQQEDMPRVGVGAWVKLGTNEVTLGPGEQRTIPFTITIPDSVSVGEHSGGIIIQKTSVGDSGTGANGASIITRVGIRVYETVPGEVVRSIEFAGFDITKQSPKDKPQYYRVDLSVQNKSNVSLKAHTTLSIKGWGKLKYFPNSHFKDGFSLDFSDFTNFFNGQKLETDWQLLRDQKVSTNWEWPKPAFGHYTFQAEVRYDGENGPVKIVSPIRSITVIPWDLLIFIFVLIIILCAFMVMRKMRYGGKKWVSYQVKQGDQLASLAEQAGVSWKMLSKVNKLKTPMVTEGQTILMPPKFIVPAQSIPASVQPVVKIAEAAPVETSMSVPKKPVRRRSTKKSATTAITKSSVSRKTKKTTLKKQS